MSWENAEYKTRPGKGALFFVIYDAVGTALSVGEGAGESGAGQRTERLYRLTALGKLYRLSARQLQLEKRRDRLFHVRWRQLEWLPSQKRCVVLQVRRYRRSIGLLDRNNGRRRSSTSSYALRGDAKKVPWCSHRHPLVQRVVCRSEDDCVG